MLVVLLVHEEKELAGWRSHQLCGVGEVAVHSSAAISVARLASSGGVFLFLSFRWELENLRTICILGSEGGGGGGLYKVRSMIWGDNKQCNLSSSTKFVDNYYITDRSSIRAIKNFLLFIYLI